MKNILLAVTGLSPQVITETLFAIHETGRPIHEIHVITTRDGKDRIFSELFGGKTGKYISYMEEYGHDPETLLFDPSTIHTVTDSYGNGIPDILTEEDNKRLLHTCLLLSFKFTRDPETAVFFSIAGGRKTMSACLTLAAQLYGRPQDRLYHVLVSPGFENNRDFYYPPKKNRAIEYKDSQGEPSYKDSRYAKVILVNIPFVSVRSLLSPENLEGPKDPGTLMLSLIRDASPHLIVDLKQRKIIFRTVELDMSPAHLALYVFFALQKKACAKPENFCGSCTDCYLEFNDIELQQDRITDLYGEISQNLPSQTLSDTGITRLSAENFRSIKSKIKTALVAKFGPAAHAELKIKTLGKKSDTRYGIPLSKDKITVTWTDTESQ